MRITGITYAVRKTHKARYVILAIAILLFIAAVTLIVVSAYKSWQLLHPDKRPIDAFSSI